MNSRDGREQRLSARTPEAGASRGYQRGPQRRVRAAVISVDHRDGQETLRLLLPPPRSLCASTGHSPHHPSREPVQPATARLLWSRDKSPGRMHGTPQAAATSRRPLPPQALLAFRTPLSHRPEWARAPESAAPLTPFCLGVEQKPSGNLHAEVGPNPKLNTGSCMNKEEKGKSLPAASEAAD